MTTVEDQFVYRLANGKPIKGLVEHAFVDTNRSEPRMHFTTVVIYADSMIECSGLQTLDEFLAKVHSGKIVAALPAGTKIKLPCMGHAVMGSQTWYDNDEQFINDVLDVIEFLNGRPTQEEFARDAESSGIRGGRIPENSDHWLRKPRKFQLPLRTSSCAP